MFGADRTESVEAKESGLYDWPMTIKSLKEALAVSKEKQVAFKLGISDSYLSDVKQGIRPMPKEALKLIREKWPAALKTVQADRINAGEVKGSERYYDWRATIEALKEAMGVSKDKHVAFYLDVDETNLSEVKHALRPMPKEALKLIHEKWPAALKTVQAVEEPPKKPLRGTEEFQNRLQRGSESNHSHSPIFDNSTSLKIKELDSPGSFKSGLAE